MKTQHAFPHPMGNGHTEGMTLHDWYVGQALIGMLSNTDMTRNAYEMSKDDMSATMVRAAREVADEAIKQRNA